MTEEAPKKSALDLLKEYEREVELLSDRDAVEAARREIKRDTEGTISIPDHRGPDRDTAPSEIAPGSASLAGELALEPGLALCLSGGGYKAMLFHAGSLIRLNEAAVLPRIDRLASVSAGSIVSATLGLKWPVLEFDAEGRARNLEQAVIEPLRGLARVNLEMPGALGPMRLLTRGTLADILPNGYAEHLFRHTSLQALPDRPRIVLAATNVQSGVSWRFTKPYMGDYRVGLIRNPTVPLAVAVAASSAFAPYHWPVELRLDPRKFDPESGIDLRDEASRSRALLADGGLRDTLALESVWNRYRSILVSDGGSAIRTEKDANRFQGLVGLLSKTARMTEIAYGQVRAVYKQQLINSFSSGLRTGAYWGLRSSIDAYSAEEALPVRAEGAAELAELPTTFVELDGRTQERLINWGYAATDAAMRTYFDRSLRPAEGFPFPTGEI